jgi:uncharacterized ferritin-like protein (DUF455 family)
VKPLPATLCAGALAVLGTAEPDGKVRLTHVIATAWRSGRLQPGEAGQAPPRPARPARPLLLSPRDMPKRRAGGGLAARVALLHALAHIELNAIDLAWDLIARFPPPAAGFDDARFYDDWVRVADEEAKHFAMIAARLGELGAAYGDLPAHDGLWQAAEATAKDLAARLAVVPMVFEARGLDVTPAMITRFRDSGDEASARILEAVLHDEIGHVEIGRHWFEKLVAGQDPVDAWHALVRQYHRGGLKRPFNESARAAAGLRAEFYEPLAPE